MNRCVAASAVCVLSIAMAGCRTTTTRISVGDPSKWSAEGAIALINNTFDAHEQLMQSMPPDCYVRGGSLAAIESAKHIADRGGLITVENQGLMKLKVYHVPYADIQKVETQKTDYFFVPAVFCGIVNPFSASEFRVDLTRTNGKVFSYCEQSMAWNKWAVFPLWGVRPFYNHGGAKKRVQEIGEAFEFLRLNPPLVTETNSVERK